MIGLLSFHQCHNFGAVLQAYALQQSITKLGYESEYINIDNEVFHWHGKKADHIAYKNPYIDGKMLSKKVSEQLRTRWELFEDFISKNIRTSDLIHDEASASVLLDRYKLLIAGGDQLWNNNIPVALDIYAIPFNTEIPKVSYGTSMGNTQHISLRKRMFLNHFVSIGVREEASVSYLRKYVNVPVTKNVDPVFLLKQEEWLKIINPVKEKGYIFIYIFNNGITDFKERISNIRRMGQKLDKKVVICANDIVTEASLTSVIDISPIQWLSLLAGAEYVVTNSFHGMAFSLIFQKQFLVLDFDERKRELLQTCNIPEKENETLDTATDGKGIFVDYKKVTLKLAKEIEASKTYLERICGLENDG